MMDRGGHLAVHSPTNPQKESFPAPTRQASLSEASPQDGDFGSPRSIASAEFPSSTETGTTCELLSLDVSGELTIESLEPAYANCEQSFREASLRPYPEEVCPVQVFAHANTLSASSNEPCDEDEAFVGLCTFEPLFLRPPSLDAGSPVPDVEFVTFFHSSSAPPFSLYYLGRLITTAFKLAPADAAGTLTLLRRFAANWKADPGRRQNPYQPTVTLHMMHRSWVACLAVYLEARHRREDPEFVSWPNLRERLAGACSMEAKELDRLVAAAKLCLSEADIGSVLSSAEPAAAIHDSAPSN